MCELADLETSTFLLFCAESGQRDGTIADLTLSHVEDCLNGEPYIFTIPQKRNRYGKILKSKRIYGKYGFVCADAVEKLKVLLKTKPNLGVEDKIFENEPGSYSRTVRTMAYRLGINRNNRGLRRFHVHCLRKRAQTIMEEYIPLNWVDRILGHKPRGSQADAYSIPSKEKLAEKYASAADALRIYGEEKQEESEVDELKQRITELEALVGKLAN